MILLGTTLSSVNTINKQFNKKYELTGTFRDVTDTMNPVILINITNNEILNCNYCYIAEFGLWYWVEFEAVRTNMYNMKCTRDPLMSFKDEILNLYAIVDRSQDGDPYIPGDQFVPTSKIATQVIQFDTQIPDNPNIILCMSGGYTS